MLLMLYKFKKLPFCRLPNRIVPISQALLIVLSCLLAIGFWHTTPEINTGKGYEHNVVVPRSLSDMFTMLLSILDILRFVSILCTSSYDAFTYDLCLWRSTPKQQMTIDIRVKKSHFRDKTSKTSSVYSFSFSTDELHSCVKNASRSP